MNARTHLTRQSDANTSRERKRPVRHPRSGRPPCQPLSARAQATIDAAPRGFTLVEMIVVISIIMIILGLVLPAVSSLWQGRKKADAINTIQGLLMTTRAAALKTDGVQSGFFAFVDTKGVQRFVSIAQEPTMLGESAWQNIFVVTEGVDRALPPPLRVVPRYVVDDPSDPNHPGREPYEMFSDEELANNDFRTLPTSGIVNQAQRHRNFFTMIYSTDGQLIVNRDVLILDLDEDKDGVGDRTGLTVDLDPKTADPPATVEFYVRDAATVDEKKPLDPSDSTATVPFLVVDPKDDTVALNFPSVDGPLVYDDSLFTEMPDFTSKRDMLLQTGQPLYVSRWTGTVIRGPIGENESVP